MKQLFYFILIIFTLSACTTTKTATKKEANVDVKVILLGGQSNMVGAGNYNNLSESDKARLKKASETVSLSENGKVAIPLSFRTGKKSEKYDFAEKFGPELFLGITLAEKYPNQRIFVIDVEGYAYLVPYVESDEHFFLKTIIPSRKATRIYLGESDE